MNTITINTKAVGLIADMQGDAQQGNIDASLALRITLALLRGNSEALATLAQEITEAGWHCVVSKEDAQQYVNAYNYICVAAQIVKG